MTAGLMGSGTEVDPWLISTVAEAASVLRDASSAGYYALTASISFTLAQALPMVSASSSAGYAPKVIDLRGKSLLVFGFSGYLSGALINTHFRNGTLYLRVRANSSPVSDFAFVGCGMTDVRLRLDRGWTGSGAPIMSGKIFGGAESLATLIPRTLTRVMIQWQTTDDSIPPANAWSGGLGGTVADYYEGVEDIIVRRVETPGWVDSTISAAVTLWETYGMRLMALPAGQAGRFSAAGWWDDLTVQGIYPHQAVLHPLLVNTYSAGAPVSRPVWVESRGRRDFLGYTDESGIGSFNAHVRMGAPLLVSASEGYLTELLQSHVVVASDKRYMVAGIAGTLYVPDRSGDAGDLGGAVFADTSVTVNGITYTPVPHYRTVVSDLLGGVDTPTTFTVSLDTSAGGGGPVIDGDPAYLDGIVEQIHPMTGARQALSNCEVVAFERRGSDYVAMGSTYTDGIGGFRLETEVYGGGDVFAFSADFPGVIFQPGLPLNVGDRIRPALANGYVYEIVQPGTAGPAEPVWWPDQGGGTEGDIGTARARARPYYQPVGHGPLKMTLIE